MLRATMARATRARLSASNAATTKTQSNAKRTAVKRENEGEDVEMENVPQTSTRSSKRSAAPSPAVSRQSKRVKTEAQDEKTGLPSPPAERDEDEDGDGDFKASPSPSSASSAENSEADDDDYQKDKKKPSKTTPKKSPKTKTKTSTKTKAGDKKSKSDKSGGSSKDLSEKKLQAYFKNANQSPFPSFKHPTSEEAKLAHKILSELHGARTRPEKVVASKDSAGCGDSPSVLDALVRTILSQNTSDKNSTRAKLNMDKVYGGSDEWEKIVEGGESKLQQAIKSGGLSVTKSKVIISILRQAKSKYGKYSLDHLFDKTNEEAMREMLSFQGVGPKTASCVLLFCLQRESFAVDTHVHRITGLLGWRPKTANRDETHSHLDVMIPDEDKYGLHILLVKHGKVCDECKAGGKNVGKCALRRAFRQGKIKGEAGEDVKEEEKDVIKHEDGDSNEDGSENDEVDEGDDEDEGVKKEEEDEDED